MILLMPKFCLCESILTISGSIIKALTFLEEPPSPLNDMPNSTELFALPDLLQVLLVSHVMSKQCHTLPLGTRLGLGLGRCRTPTPLCS